MIAVAPRHYLGLPAQHYEPFRIVRACGLVGRLCDDDARTTRNDLLDAAAGAVKLDAEMKLLDPWAGHERTLIWAKVQRTNREHIFGTVSRARWL